MRKSVDRCQHKDAVRWNEWNQVVQCHRCGEVFVPGSAAGPADAVYAFAAWLTSRYRQSGPFSRYLNAAPAAELADDFCKANGWEVTANYPHNFHMPPDGGLNPSKP